MNDDVLAIQRAFPRIYLACHREHQRGSREADRLSPRFNTLLGHLQLDRGVSLGALAAHLGLGLPAVSDSVNELEDLGLLTRSRSAADRRRLELRLTRQGVAALAATSVLDAGLLEGVLERLSPDERRRAVEGLDLLARACDQRRAPRRRAAT
jgi:DNA-binding MarR family transcriptional regulator